MGRPIKRQKYFDHVGPNHTPAIHQIQSTTWGAADSSVQPGYLTKQKSQNKFRAHTVNGNSLTVLCNGTPTSTGFSSVKVFPLGNDPITYATGTANLKAVNATLVSGGGQYHVNDVLNLVGGTSAHAANITVNSVGANNTIATFTLNTIATNQGYVALPSNIAGVATTDTTNANGTGAIFSVNFGLESVNITYGGSNYSNANIAFPQATNQPTTTPIILGGVVQNNVVVNTSGIINVGNPTMVIEGNNGTTEYVKYLQSEHQLLTFQGHVYNWLPKGAIPPADYQTLGISLAYLDTL